MRAARFHRTVLRPLSAPFLIGARSHLLNTVVVRTRPQTERATDSVICSSRGQPAAVQNAPETPAWCAARPTSPGSHRSQGLRITSATGRVDRRWLIWSSRVAIRASGLNFSRGSVRAPAVSCGLGADCIHEPPDLLVAKAPPASAPVVRESGFRCIACIESVGVAGPEHTGGTRGLTSSMPCPHHLAHMSSSTTGACP